MVEGYATAALPSPLEEVTFRVSNIVNVSTTVEFGSQKIPMQYTKWKETVQKSMSDVLFYIIQSQDHFSLLRLLWWQTFTWTCCKVTQYPKCSIYNPLISSNNMVGSGCSSILLELGYQLDILRVTKGAHLEVH
ncbi:hypothetical protein AVEN_196234-1 [Araneus ventricosus]|uniref:Uncharacterized protein n=1 Tax=Araneus ventricosus TaxID=182803 RepID=A0A4Y2UE48_ARAVE|nr:hypothetical protein AVEN_196234-1 [Araneus ventricosus]